MKRLEKSSEDRVIAGVCGGLADYLGCDADVVRVVTIVLALTGGVGALVYVAALFLLPDGAPGAPVAASRSSANVGLVLVGLAAFLALGQLGVQFRDWWSWRFVIPVAIAGAGVALVWPGTRRLFPNSSSGATRSYSDRMLAGVAGGLGENLGTDPNLVRLSFVFLAVVTGGVGALAYLLLMLAVPAAQIASPPSGPPESSGTGPAPQTGEAAVEATWEEEPAQAEPPPPPPETPSAPPEVPDSPDEGSVSEPDADQESPAPDR